MGTITTGVGLVSGIDTASLIEQLLALEARAKIPIQQRIAQLTAQQTALLDINARLLNMKSAAGDFRKSDIFTSALATSSNDSALTATAEPGALAGSYTFIVDRLVTTAQKMTRGFADRDTSAVGLTQLSFELGRGQLQTDTELALLNGGEGVRRGKIRITDQSGAAAVIDLSRAGELSEVLAAINDNESIDVTASVSGDRLVLTDDSGGAGNLIVENVGTSLTATDLGILGNDGGTGTLTGSAINSLSGATALGALNDGTGVLVQSGIGNTDFVITDRSGAVHNIVLGQWDNGSETEAAVSTIEGVINRINDITAGAVTAAIAADGVSLELTDTTGGGGNFSVTGGGTNGDATAAALGILNAGVASNTISGSRVLAGLNSVLIGNLNGGSGLDGATTITVQDRSGASFTVNNLDTYESLTDLIDALNDAATAGGVDVAFSYNDAGNGLHLTDTSGGGGNLIVSGDGAAALGVETAIAGVAASSVRGTNLQHQYVAGSSRLSDLNYGRGVGTGKFRLFDATGDSAEVDIGSDAVTLQDIIAEINSKGLELQARVNDTGDGMIIENTSATGTLAIRVESVAGTVARDLGIVGEAEDPVTANFIDGSYERTIEFDAADTLADIASAINDANVPVAATIVNTGSGASPFRLSFTSEVTGAGGEMSIDAFGFDLGITTLSTGKDARVFFGSSDPATAVLLNSRTNTLDGVIDEVSIDLNGASDDAVTLTVSRDDTKIVDAVKRLVTTFNDIMGRVNDYDKYDAETEARGVLLGDPTVATIRTQLFRTLNSKAVGVEGRYQYLSQIGIRVTTDGQLEFREAAFREALASDPEDVEALFAAFDVEQEDEILEGDVETGNTTERVISLGVAEQFARMLDNLTNSIDGTVTRAKNGFQDQIDLANSRMDRIDERLEAKRIILQRQFSAMEAALSQLQSQQSAIAGLSSNVLLASTSGLARGR
jgi:flagellar hook-associated protein 2